MDTRITEKELKQLRRLGNRLSSYRSDIDEMLSVLADLEQRLNAGAPEKPVKRKSLKEERKDKFRTQLRKNK